MLISVGVLAETEVTLPITALIPFLPRGSDTTRCQTFTLLFPVGLEMTDSITSGRNMIASSLDHLLLDIADVINQSASGIL